MASAFVGEEKTPVERPEEAEVTKIEHGQPRPAGDFLVVVDPDKPSTWHLPVRVNGKLDRRLCGAAWAALHEDYRGHKYEGPDRQEAISKLRGIYESQGWSLPDEKGKE